MFKVMKELLLDAKNIYEKDPACKNILHSILLYPGFHILVFHRIAYFLNSIGFKFIARLPEIKVVQKCIDNPC